MVKPFLLAIGLTVGLSLSAGQVYADGTHYHIVTTARLIADASGKVTAVGVNWIYDTAVSAALMDGEDMSEAGRVQSLRDRAADMVTDLSEKDYFTYLSIADQPPVAVKPVEEYGMIMSPEGNLKFSFRLNLAQPMDIKGKTVLLRMADMEGTFTLSYPDPQSIFFDDALACSPPTIDKVVLELPNGHKPLVETAKLQCR